MQSKVTLLNSNCDIDFFNFRHCLVQNFNILNLFERNWNLESSFESTDSETESQQSALQFHESEVLYH